MKTFAPLSTEQTSSDAFAAILGHNMEALASWHAAAHDWRDIEGVHQVRVSFRRMRSALSVFKSMLPKDDRKAWAKTIQDLVEATGKARDFDVLIAETLPAFHATPKAPPSGDAEVLAVLERKRTTAYDQVRAMLDGPDYGAFRRDFTQWIETSGWRNGELSEKKRKRQARPISAFARKQLEIHHRLVMERGDATDPGDAAAMHKLRIACKKLRYATEFFTPLFDGMDPYTKHLKLIQDTLGYLHDTAVMTVMLDSLLDDTEDGDARRFIEALIAWRERQGLEMVRHFANQWDDFKAGPFPWRDEPSIVPK